ncbi:MAG: sigma-70 family RNA polymerase sigma factor [Clostridia bacterium]|nr:sigma-70 family RNA polymerase sigma factor [Clostridia bacterium]
MNISSLRNEEKILSWLCQIAKNTYFAWYKEQKKKSSFDNLEDTYCDKNVEEDIVQMELTRKAMDCLNNLEEPYKEVFKLYVFGEFSLKDISLAFGKSESWARDTFYRAKQKIVESMR